MCIVHCRSPIAIRDGLSPRPAEAGWRVLGQLGHSVTRPPLNRQPTNSSILRFTIFTYQFVAYRSNLPIVFQSSRPLLFFVLPKHLLSSTELNARHFLGVDEGTYEIDVLL